MQIAPSCLIYSKMAFDSTTRNLVESHYNRGKTPKQICYILAGNVSIRTVRRWVNVLSKNKSISPNRPAGLPRTVRTGKLVKTVKRSIEFGVRTKSARQLAKDNNCSDRTIRRVIHDDLGFPKPKYC